MTTIRNHVFLGSGNARRITVLAALFCVALSAQATLVSTDPVTGGRTYRFTPTDADFLDSFSTKWNTNPGAYFHDYEVYEFEESDAPYVFAQNIWVQRHPFLTFRGVKADGSDADPAKVVFAFQTEGTSACFQLESATNSFANITFAGMAINPREPSTTVSNCVFKGLSDRSAIYGVAAKTDVVAIDCIFTNNVFANSPVRTHLSVAATNCVFSGNANTETSINGGGAISGVANLSCENCVFTDNRTTGWYGGAILMNGGVFAIDRCSFVGNNETVTYNRNDGCGGGAVSVIGSATGYIRNCLFVSNSCSTPIGKNTRSYGGGAIYVSGASTAVSIENCTLSGNSVSDTSGSTTSDIGGALLVASGTVGVTNCVFHENRTRLADGGWGSWKTAHLYLPAACWALAANCLEANFTYDNTYYDFTKTENTNLHNLSDGANGNKVGNYDPKFTDATNGDYTLQKGSPCRDAGALLAWMTDGSLDIGGNARIFGNAPDMGCYEWWQKSGLSIFVR